MIVPSSSTESFLRSKVRRLAMSGRNDEALAALRNFLELEREAAMSRALERQDESSSPKVIHLPLLRPVS